MKSPMAGWIGFAGIVMLVIGSLDFFEGLIAVIRNNYYVIHGNQLIVFDTTTWGWIMMIWGVLIALVGLALLSGAGWARWVTIILASVNVLGQLESRDDLRVVPLFSIRERRLGGSETTA
jgi:hypothetical protein